MASQDPKYDFNLYQIGNIKWALSDTPNYTVSQINKSNITQKANIYPFLGVLFGDLSEYGFTYKIPVNKAQITKEQKEARQKEIASVTQEEINQSIKDLESGKTPYIYNPGF